MGHGKGDAPLQERTGARVDIGPPRTTPVAWHDLIEWRGEHGRTRALTDADTDWTMQTETELSMAEKRGGYVCLGYPLCEDMDCDCEGPQTEVEQEGPGH